MNPFETIEQAVPGSTILYTLRGPATADEIEEVRRALEAQYPSLKFLVRAGAEESHATILE